MKESALREQMTALARSLFERGLARGTAGNISARLGDGWLMTPTNSSFADLDPARISKLDSRGELLSGDPPTKERLLHMAMYERSAAAGAVVHVHSTHAVAVSCLKDVDPRNVLPPITPYYITGVGRLALVGYFKPGDPAMADAVRRVAGDDCRAVLLANHGPVVSAETLEQAVYATEELEETSKLYLLLHGRECRFLTPDQVADLL